MASRTTSKSLLDRFRDEYTEGQQFLEKKKLRQVQQLVLLNNLGRSEETIGTSTLFSFLNRMVSGLYANVMQIRFRPSEDSDYKKTEVLNKTAQNDYQEMEKSIIDYDSIWDRK